MTLNFLMFAIDELPDEYSKQLRSYRILIRFIDAWGLMIAGANFAGALNLTLYKSDGFTWGRMAGILVKIIIQLKLNIITGNQTYLDREISDMIAF